jgi:hypothetical protein
MAGALVAGTLAWLAGRRGKGQGGGAAGRVKHRLRAGRHLPLVMGHEGLPLDVKSLLKAEQRQSKQEQRR